MVIMDDEIRSIFAGTHPDKVPCADCGGIHERACPRVKRKAWHPNGNIAEVEYWQIWDRSDIVWPEDAFSPS